MRIVLLLCAITQLLWAETKIIPKNGVIPDGWICVLRTPLGYTIKEPEELKEFMLSVTPVPSGYITVDIIPKWAPPYDKVFIEKVVEEKHYALGLPKLPPGYIITDIIFRWKRGLHRYTVEKLTKKQHRMLSVTPIPTGYEEISRIPKWRGTYDLITIQKVR